MAAPPPVEVLEAIVAPTTRIIRRVEIYEQDGETRWNIDNEIRLIDGGVTVDYTRDERRALDLTLDNADGDLVNAPGQLWYDKIVKVFRGIELRQKSRAPKILIIGGTEQDTLDFRAALVTLGFDNIRINTLASDMADVTGYEIIVSLGGDSAAPSADLLQSAYDAGLSIFSEGNDTPMSALPFVTSIDASESRSEWLIQPNLSQPSELTAGWVAESYASATGTLPTGLSSEAIGVSAVTIDAQAGYTIIAAENPNGYGGKWLHFHPDLSFTTNFSAFLKVAFTWLNPFVPIQRWEVQVGEFMIDNLAEGHFPKHMKITGRDYTKRCMLSKFVVATAFTGSYDLEDLISAIAANAGITKKVLPATGVTVNRDFMFERGVTRWEAMKQIANSYSYDIFFDNQGYLRMVLQSDPATSAPSFVFETGQYGNLASYEKSTNDSRLYNHVLCVGGAADSTSLPPWAESKNENPASPTCIDEIGDRLYEYDSTFMTTEEQCQDVADKFLAVHALEEFVLSFESIIFPWLEVGEIIQWIDPDPAPDDPDMFLLTSLSIPLGLGTMSGSGARVTKVV